VTSEETERTNAAGDVISCLLTASPIRLPDGKLSGVMKDFRDITEMKRLRAVAEAKTEASNIGYVFSGIRHEIGNPINSCKMALSVLSDNFETFPPETAKEFLSRALGEVTRVEQLLRALRSFSMKEEVRLARGDIREFLEELDRLLGAECQRRGIDFQAVLDPDVQWAVYDPQALHQVLIHLFSNAVDALADTAEPTIRMTSKKRNTDVRILFADNGCGIEASAREHLFKPFYTSKPKGIGMGLAIAKKLVAAMRGTVTISGTPGGGAAVEIVLPLEEEDRDHEAPKPAHH
jgi:signal transduction histidine kinase